MASVGCSARAVVARKATHAAAESVAGSPQSLRAMTRRRIKLERATSRRASSVTVAASVGARRDVEEEAAGAEVALGEGQLESAPRADGAPACPLD